MAASDAFIDGRARKTFSAGSGFATQAGLPLGSIRKSAALLQQRAGRYHFLHENSGDGQQRTDRVGGGGRISIGRGMKLSAWTTTCAAMFFGAAGDTLWNLERLKATTKRFTHVGAGHSRPRGDRRAVQRAPV